MAEPGPTAGRGPYPNTHSRGQLSTGDENFTGQSWLILERVARTEDCENGKKENVKLVIVMTVLNIT